MRLPGVLDAAVRYLVLTAVGLLLYFWVPADVFEPAPAWIFAGHPGPTHANLIGMAVILAAWLYFMVVFGIRAAGQHDRVCWVALVVAMGAAPTCCLAALAGETIAARVLFGVVALAELALAVRLVRHPMPSAVTRAASGLR